jgi:hypothetical protein
LPTAGVAVFCWAWFWTYSAKANTERIESRMQRNKTLRRFMGVLLSEKSVNEKLRRLDSTIINTCETMALFPERER